MVCAAPCAGDDVIHVKVLDAEVFVATVAQACLQPIECLLVLALLCSLFWGRMETKAISPRDFCDWPGSSWGLLSVVEIKSSMSPMVELSIEVMVVPWGR